MMMRDGISKLACTIGLLWAVGVSHAAAIDETIETSIESALSSLRENRQFDAAVGQQDIIFDQVIAYVSDRNRDLFVEAAFARRLSDLLAQGDEGPRESVLPFLLDNRRFTAALVFAANLEDEDASEILRSVDALRAARGDMLDRYANIAAAICLVHDRKLEARINENKSRAPDFVAIFDYFVANERAMYFPIREMPTELAIYVVDTTANIEEMRWALDRYAGDQNVGARFFDVEYDYDHFRKGTTKKVTAAGWNLPNILQYGGVCADQAYFAMTVGKSIGVPTTYTIGRDGDVSHAWVGFLQSDGRRAWWNFNSGRYESYQGVRGVVVNPQTRKPVPDSSISLLAEFGQAKTLERRFAAAMNDAAIRLMEFERDSKQLPLQPIEDAGDPIRSANVEDVLELLEIGGRACPGYAGTWFTLGELSANDKLTLKEKKKWADVLHKLCGRWYPDFYLAIVAPMIGTVDDIKVQNQLWNAAFRNFDHRKDLAAEVRMLQADMWERAGRPERAGQCYEDVINRFANDGPFVLNALRKAEAILAKQGDASRILALYERAWSGTTQPQKMAAAFSKQSNWFQVGKRYAERLHAAGYRQDAERVLSELQKMQ